MTEFLFLFFNLSCQMSFLQKRRNDYRLEFAIATSVFTLFFTEKHLCFSVHKMFQLNPFCEVELELTEWKTDCETMIAQNVNTMYLLCVYKYIRKNLIKKWSGAQYSQHFSDYFGVSVDFNTFQLVHTSFFLRSFVHSLVMNTPDLISYTIYVRV